MKTKLYSVITLLICMVLVFVSNGFTQQTLLEPSVRLIYFLPNDRPARPDRIEALRQLIKDTQQFYADEMERHGYSRKTFRVETDRSGEPIVHRFNGRFNERHYYERLTDFKVWEEFFQQVNDFQHVYLIAIDLSYELLNEGESCGLGGVTFSPANGDASFRFGSTAVRHRDITPGEKVLGGSAIMPASGHCFYDTRGFLHPLKLVTHELAHAFGLDHDFSDPDSAVGGRGFRFSASDTEWLSVSRFFNSNPVSENASGNIQLISAPTYSAEGIALHFEVTDVDGLHQAQLLVPDDGSWGPWKLIGSQALNGQTQRVEFLSSELTSAPERVMLQFMDDLGNITWATFLVDIASLLPPPKVVSIPDPNLAAAIRSQLGLASGDMFTDRAMKKLESLSVDDRKITNIAGLEYATQLRELFMGRNQIKNYAPLARLPKLKILFLWTNNISDLNVLPPMPQLELLDLNWNQISDLSPLAKFTSLKELWLQGNKLTDTSTLFQLHSGTFPPDEEVKVVKERDNSDRAYTLLIFQSLDLKVRVNPDVKVYRSLNSLQDAQKPIPATDVVVEKSRPATDVVVEKSLPATNVVVQGAVRSPMYWINTRTGTLHRLVDTEVESLVPRVRNANSLAVDVVGGKLYWAERTSDKTGRIRRANLDGTNVQLVKKLTSVPHGIALDTANSKIYLTNSWGKVQRLNVDGSNFQPNLITGLDTPRSIALDMSNGKVYWAETTGRIRRANLDGSDVEDIVTGLGTPMGLVVFDGTVYWTEMTGENQGEIQRVNLDGTNTEMLLTLTSIPRGIALDPMENKLYWTNSRGKIQRANLDGSHIENLITGLVAPGDLMLQIAAPLPPPTVVADERVPMDVNDDGIVNIQDLVRVASSFGQTGENVADVNDDDIVNIQDLVLVAGAFGSGTAAAPTLHLQAIGGFDALEVQHLLTQAREMSLTDPAYLRGIAVLEQLLVQLVPTETALLSNYPNPFNPETWIPYQLGKPADITLRIYAANGVLVRTLALGHQSAGIYKSRSRAAYWDGRNEVGEPVASGVYFYTLSAGDFTATRKMLIRK